MVIMPALNQRKEHQTMSITPVTIKPMSAAELRTGLFELELTQKDLAKITDYSTEQINAMCRSRAPVRHTVGMLVRLMIEVPAVKRKLFPDRKPTTRSRKTDALEEATP